MSANIPDGYALIRIPADWERHPVFITDDGIVPTCDICEGPQRIEEDDWNGETGNHYSCEDREEEANYIPCDICGVYPGDPHNGEAHLAEMRYEPDPIDFYDRYLEDNSWANDDYMPEDKCWELNRHSMNTSNHGPILFGPNNDVLADDGGMCDDCGFDLASDWKPEGYKVTRDWSHVLHERVLESGRRLAWIGEGRFAVYEKIV